MGPIRAQGTHEGPAMPCLARPGHARPGQFGLATPDQAKPGLTSSHIFPGQILSKKVNSFHRCSMQILENVPKRRERRFMDLRGCERILQYMKGFHRISVDLRYGLEHAFFKKALVDIAHKSKSDRSLYMYNCYMCHNR